MDVLRSICCCGTGEEVQEGPPYERLHRGSTDTRTSINTTAIRQHPPHYSNGGINEDNQLVAAAVSPKEENEEQMLNRILESTQHCIIDVGQFTSPANLNSQEYVTRTKAYDDAIREHDQAANKLPHAQERLARHEIVEDAGVYVQDWLGRPAPLSPQAMADMRTHAQQLTHAILNDFKIEHKNDVVVDMEL